MIKLENRIAAKQIEGMVAALTDPIIVFDPGWADVLPDWLKAEVTLQRLAQQMKGEEGLATDAEALAYVSNASLAVPLDSDWAEIYQYLFTRVMKDKAPEDLRRESLDNWRMGLLGELKQWLWRQRVKASEERVRSERAKAKVELKAKAPKQLGLGL